MTIQEAINWIKEKHCPDDWNVDCDDANAMRMAIDALTKLDMLNIMFEGSVKHFDYTDAMDLVYDAKSVLHV